MTDRAPAPSCPSCGAAAVPIVYGEPIEELGRAEARGELVLGGCCLSDDADPAWACRDCGARWGLVDWEELRRLAQLDEDDVE